MRLSDVAPPVAPALAAFLAWLGGAPASAEEGLEALARRYADIKARQGRAAVAQKLGLAEADLAAFDASLREAVRRLQRLAPDAPAVEGRNALIAALRFLAWLESFVLRAPELALGLDLPEAGGEEVGRKQVRALELIIRSLVTERYESQERLVGRLKDLLSEPVVQKWLAAADQGDVLSGTTFGELASLFVSQQEFPGYEPLYRETLFLSLLKEKRLTLRHYLDDIRRVRNMLAHNKRVTPLQVALLDLYYEELVEPLQEAFDQGRSKVNPELFLDVSAEEMEAWFGRLTDDMRAVRDDLTELRAELTQRLDSLAEETGQIRETTAEIRSTARGTSRRLWVALAGIAAVAVVGGVGLWVGLGTKETTEATLETAKRVEETTQQTQEDVGEVKETTEEIQKTGQQTQETAEQIKEATEKTQEQVAGLAQTAEDTKQAIEQMAENLQQLANTGGLVADPKTPAELYHNARLLAQRGEIDRALEAYGKLFVFPIPYADPVLDLSALLRAKYGASGAPAALPSVLPAEADPRIRAFAAQAVGAETPIEAAKRLAADADPYPPGLWLAVEGLMGLPHDRFSFSLRRLAVIDMAAVRDALNDGSLARLYLDQIRVDAIRQQLASYERQFPSGVLEAYDRPLDVSWEQFTWVDGEAKIRIMFMWNPAAAAMNWVEPPELWVRFPGARAPFNEPVNIFDAEAALANQKTTYPPDMEVPAQLQKMALDLVASQNPMAFQFFVPQPAGSHVLAELRFTELGGFDRHLCLAVPNTQGAGDLEYRPLGDCALR